MYRFIAIVLMFIPKNIFSQVLGFLARIQIPRPLRPLLLRVTAKLLAIDLEESQNSVREFKSLEDMFVRKLQSNARPLLATFIFPADGVCSFSCEVSEVIKAKEVELPPQKFLEDEKANPYWSSLVYLAPHNYHRVHCPCNATLITIRHIHGKFWPVNPKLTKFIPKVFLENERLVFTLEHSQFGRFYLIMVGALNVGRMSSVHAPQLLTNSKLFMGAGASKEYPVDKELIVGDELGVFSLGSTVVLMFEKGFKDVCTPFPGSTVRVGEPLFLRS